MLQQWVRIRHWNPSCAILQLKDNSDFTLLHFSFVNRWALASCYYNSTSVLLTSPELLFLSNVAGLHVACSLTHHIGGPVIPLHLTHPHPSKHHTVSYPQKAVLLESIVFHLIFVTSFKLSNSSYLMSPNSTLLTALLQPNFSKPCVIFIKVTKYRKRLIFEKRISSIQPEKFTFVLFYLHYTS